MAIERKISLGNIIQIAVLIIGGIAFYFGSHSQIVRILENHEVRLETVESEVDQSRGDIRNLYQTKVDKN